MNNEMIMFENVRSMYDDVRSFYIYEHIMHDDARSFLIYEHIQALTVHWQTYFFSSSNICTHSGASAVSF